MALHGIALLLGALSTGQTTAPEPPTPPDMICLYPPDRVNFVSFSSAVFRQGATIFIRPQPLPLLTCSALPALVALEAAADQSQLELPLLAARRLVDPLECGAVAAAPDLPDRRLVDRGRGGHQDQTDIARILVLVEEITLRMRIVTKTVESV